MAYILLKLLTLIGGRPVTQKSTKVLGDLRKKPYVVGIFFCLFHFCFIIISDYVTELISVTDPEVFKEENNIMQAIVDLGRFTSFIQQPVLVITSYFQSKAFLEFVTKINTLDDYLAECGANVNLILRKLLSVDRVITFVVTMTTILCLFIINYVFETRYGVAPFGYDIYISLMPLTNYLLHISVACLYFYGVLLRMEAFNNHLKELCQQCRYSELRFVA